MRVSVPTSRRPIEAVGISYFSSRFLVTAFSRGCPHRRSAYTLYLRACVEAERTGQEERVDVFAVVAKGHLVGSEANGVLAGRDAVKLFEVSLVDASQRRVDLDGVWMDDETRIGEEVDSIVSTRAGQQWWPLVESGTGASDLRIPTFCGRVAGFGWCGWKREADISIGFLQEEG